MLWIVITKKKTVYNLPSKKKIVYNVDVPAYQTRNPEL